MLSDITPVATLPTADMAKARGFYEGTLGLAPQREGMGGVTYNCGDGTVFVYESAYAGTNKATAVSFNVAMTAFDDEVATLRDKGVSFLTFEAEGLEWHDGVASMGGVMKAVWFTDPDGNILNIAAGALEPAADCSR
jgi:catechol 2,3-dioxygenase-like lactoylglutathione lyase family enzyme